MKFACVLCGNLTIVEMLRARMGFYQGMGRLLWVWMFPFQIQVVERIRRLATEVGSWEWLWLEKSQGSKSEDLDWLLWEGRSQWRDTAWEAIQKGEVRGKVSMYPKCVRANRD